LRFEETGGGSQGFFFDQGNRMVLANGVAGCSYDGHGRRDGIQKALTALSLLKLVS
jgi:hypothetical protein